MDPKLTPQMADEKNFEGEGGSYHSWSPTKCPMLSEAKVGGGVLSLQPLGFALPHYADCSKIGFVLQGSCTVGLVAPNSSQETVLTIKEGDKIPVQMGGVSWWYNGGDTQVVIVFLGETTKACVPGRFTYFFMSGTLSMLGGFSTEFISKACNNKLNENEASKLVKSQTGTLIVKLKEEMTILPSSGGPDKLSPVLGEVGLSGKLVKIEANEMLSPIYDADSAVRISYVVKGSGSIQIVGLNGQRVLDTTVEAGHMFVVPKFFAFAIIASGEGMECFSVVTSPD